MTNEPEQLGKQPDSLAMLAVLSFVSGAAAGLIGAWFRLALGWADGLRATAITRAQPFHLVGLVLVIAGCAAAVALAAWLVRRFAPYASGSGIPHVEAVILKQLPQTTVWLIPVKFIGGILAIGSGLALGREGPSVQMGASAAHFLGTIFRRDSSDRLVLLAAGAGAGLATAFNAPIAGAIFVLEELVRRFDTRIAIATFGASTGAIAVSRLMLGDRPDFAVELQPYPGFATVPLYLSLGVVAGLLGVLYNRTTLAPSPRLRDCAICPSSCAGNHRRLGGIAGVVSSESCRRRRRDHRADAGRERVVALALRGVRTATRSGCNFLLGRNAGRSVRAAPGARRRAACCLVCCANTGCRTPSPTPRPLRSWEWPRSSPEPYGPPVTGIVLVTEMTANFTLLLPMLAACFAAMLVPTLLNNAPIYDSLREVTLRMDRSPNRAAPQSNLANET